MLTVVKKSESDLAGWLATEIGFLEGIGRYDEEPIVLDTYQRFFLEQRARYRCVEKARQVGFSFLFALEAIARSHLRDTQTSVFVSYNLSDSKEKITYARQLYEELPLAYQKRLVVDSKLELAFESNSAKKTISRIISNPSRAPRGKKGDIYLDELAHYVDDRSVYKGSTALILRGKGQLSLCSTPLGRRGVFWEVARQELRPYSAYNRQRVPWWLCRFFCTDVQGAAVEAPDLSTAERVERFGSDGIKDQFESLLLEDFQQEFECAYVDESYSFFPYGLIIPCTEDERDGDLGSLEIWRDPSDAKGVTGRLVAGFDVGRHRDLSELAVFEQIGDHYYARMFQRFDRVPFKEQEQAVRDVLERLPIGRLSIDKTGLGMHLAENLSREFPQVIGDSFTTDRKEVLCNDFKILLQRKAITLPSDRELIAQIHSIRRRVTSTGKAKFESESTGKGHADRYWACALAVQKERKAVGGARVSMRTIG